MTDDIYYPGEVGMIPAWNGERGSIQISTIVMMVQAREAARKEKNWTVADQIRDELKGQGILSCTIRIWLGSVRLYVNAAFCA